MQRGQAVKVIGYVRVSTDEQKRSGAGLGAQRKAIRAACQARGWELLRIEADEGISARSLNRPALQRVLDAVEGGEAAGLIVAKLDRLSRSVRDFAGLLERSQRRGWALVALDLGIDTSSPTGAFTSHVVAAAAELERRLIGQRTKEALAIRREQGVRLGRPLMVVGDLEQEIHSMRTGGATWQSIADMLNERGEPTRRGGTLWRPSSVQALARRVVA